MRGSLRICGGSSPREATRVADSRCKQPGRHCERSEAIHVSTCGGMDCFVASLLAMTDKHTLTFSRRDASELCVTFGPRKRRGRRESRVRAAPANSLVVFNLGDPRRQKLIISAAWPLKMCLTSDTT